MYIPVPHPYSVDSRVLDFQPNIRCVFTRNAELFKGFRSDDLTVRVLSLLCVPGEPPTQIDPSTAALKVTTLPN